MSQPKSIMRLALTADAIALWFGAIFLLFLVAFAVFDPAQAQLIGGGGGGGGATMTQIVQWVVTNIVVGLIGAVIIFWGIRMAVGHHSLGGVLAAIVGGIVVSQWQTIAGFFGIA